MSDDSRITTISHRAGLAGSTSYAGNWRYYAWRFI
jgi:hypothetical protein